MKPAMSRSNVAPDPLTAETRGGPMSGAFGPDRKHFPRPAPCSVGTCHFATAVDGKRAEHERCPIDAATTL